MNDFTCNICATELSTERIKIEKKHNVDVAYVDCPEMMKPLGTRRQSIFMRG